jgi:predicted HTH domain antitoxin
MSAELREPSVFPRREILRQRRVAMNELERDTKKLHRALVAMASALLNIEGAKLVWNRDGRISAISFQYAARIAHNLLKAEFPRKLHPSHQEEWQNIALSFLNIAEELGYLNL